jgi:beta-glucosidase
LKDEWGFDGHITTDQGGIEDLDRKHAVSENQSDATRLALQTGNDLEIMDKKSYYRNLPELVKNGIVSEKDLDNAVRRVLLDKFRIGLFEFPYADVEKARAVTNCPQHRDLALKAAHESLVLLKNENQLLPLDASKIKTLAVIGPNAADIHLGGYSNEPRKGISVLEGMKQFANGKFEVTYAEGCKITNTPGSFWDNDNTVLNSEKADSVLIAEAAAVATHSDMVLLVIGENESICREGWAENHRGDRDDLSLFGRQADLVKAVKQTGKPVIVLLLNGRPIADNLLVSAPTLLEGWYLGQETGTAVADILFGKVNPSGKLTVTFPKNVGQLPVYYSKKPSRSRSYVNSDFEPLFPFGYGLSYTTFEYGKPQLNKTEIHKNENVKVSVSVKNSGKLKGDEIVELYIHDKVSSVTRPVMELKDFARITLNAGESRTVEFTITPEKLQFYNQEMKRVVEPGEFEVFVGPSSDKVTKTTFRVVE